MGLTIIWDKQGLVSLFCPVLIPSLLRLSMSACNRLRGDDTHLR